MPAEYWQRGGPLEGRHRRHFDAIRAGHLAGCTEERRCGTCCQNEPKTGGRIVNNVNLRLFKISLLTFTCNDATMLHVNGISRIECGGRKTQEGITMTNNNVFKCPGRCEECQYRDQHAPICWNLKEGERVIFAAHGAGVNPAAGQKARIRYMENIRRAFDELKDIDIIATVNHVRNTSNRKTGDIPTINLPAMVTCAACTRSEGGCAASGMCYAIHGLLAMYTSVKARMRNLLLFRKDPDRYFKLAAADTAAYKLARWHDSGDIVNLRYFEGMVKVAADNPTTVYLAMTKQLDIVNAFCDKYGRAAIPSNLKILISTWENFDAAENRYNFPTTGVYFE